MVDFGKLASLEFLSIRGVQWCWDAISNILQWVSEVKHLYMKVEFTGDFEALQPFPEIDFVDFFNSHPKLQKFDIHGAMFAALCQKNSLKNVSKILSYDSDQYSKLVSLSFLIITGGPAVCNSLFRGGGNHSTFAIEC